MTNQHSERNIKNYLYDNKDDVVDAKYKKISPCNEILDGLGSNKELWIFQCPKNYDPKKILDIELDKINGTSKIESCRFKDFISMGCISPINSEETIENGIVSDNIKMIKVIGKVTISENKVLETKVCKKEIPDTLLNSCEIEPNNSQKLKRKLKEEPTINDNIGTPLKKKKKNHT